MSIEVVEQNNTVTVQPNISGVSVTQNNSTAVVNGSNGGTVVSPVENDVIISSIGLQGPPGPVGPTGPPVGEEEMFDTEIDTSVPGVTYVGQAAPGTASSSALWRIKRITDTLNGSSVDWANGTADFVHTWDDHLIYTYGP